MTSSGTRATLLTGRRHRCGLSASPGPGRRSAARARVSVVYLAVMGDSRCSGDTACDWILCLKCNVQLHGGGRGVDANLPGIFAVIERIDRKFLTVKKSRGKC